MCNSAETLPEQRPAAPHFGEVIVGHLVSIILVTLVYAATAVVPLAVGPAGCCSHEIALVALLCLGGLLYARHSPKPRLFLEFAIWAVPPAAFVIAWVVDQATAPDLKTHNIILPELLELLGMAVAAAGIGACTATAAARAFARRTLGNAIALLATVVAFIATPLVVYWLDRLTH